VTWKEKEVVNRMMENGAKSLGVDPKDLTSELNKLVMEQVALKFPGGNATPEEILATQSEFYDRIESYLLGTPQGKALFDEIGSLRSGTGVVRSSTDILLRFIAVTTAIAVTMNEMKAWLELASLDDSTRALELSHEVAAKQKSAAEDKFTAVENKSKHAIAIAYTQLALSFVATALSGAKATMIYGGVVQGLEEAIVKVIGAFGEINAAKLIRDADIELANAQKLQAKAQWYETYAQRETGGTKIMQEAIRALLQSIKEMGNVIHQTSNAIAQNIAR
jgi:hypothetical protein